MIERLGNSKTANQLVTKAARQSAKTYLLKPSKAAMPTRTGQLKKATKVRSMKRSRRGAGVRVGFGEKDFVGDQFYGAFQEYGYRRGARALGNSRQQVDGKKMLTNIAKKYGKQAAEYAARLIAIGLEKIARRNG
jgi:hypothetical protein